MVNPAPDDRPVLETELDLAMATALGMVWAMDLASATELEMAWATDLDPDLVSVMDQDLVTALASLDMANLLGNSQHFQQSTDSKLFRSYIAQPNRCRARVGS